MLANKSWAGDLLANFLPYTIAVLIFSIPVLTYHRRFFASSAALVVAIGSTVQILSYASDNPGGESEAGTQLSIISLNLKRSNVDYQDVVEFLNERDADIVLLQEFTPAWDRETRVLGNTYPFSVREPLDGYFGLAILSQHSIDKIQFGKFPEGNARFLSTIVSSQGGKIEVVALHLDWPVTPVSFAWRNSQITYLLSKTRNFSRSTIICGDFNLTPWSKWYRELIGESLHDAGMTSRLSATWPSILRPAGIRLDHCLASADVRFASSSVGPAVGSDHRPILSEVSIMDVFDSP